MHQKRDLENHHLSFREKTLNAFFKRIADEYGIQEMNEIT